MAETTTPKYRFIDANSPKFIKQGSVTLGDIQGKIYVRRRVTEGYSDTDPVRGVFKPMHESFKKRKNKRTYRFANHYGEFIGYKIAEKIGIPACKVELARKSFQNKYSGKMQEVEGCISYIHKADDEDVIYAITMLEEYRREVLDKKGERTTSSDNNNFEVIMGAVEYYLKTKAHHSDSEINEVKAQIIEMTVFDCVFGNSDRSDDNWALIYRSNLSGNGKANKLELYPMYDDERILGLMEREDNVQGMLENKKAIQDYSDKVLNSRLGFPPERQMVHYADMIQYLLKEYPGWTRRALEKVFQFKEKDLDEILDNCEGLEDSYKQFAKEIYTQRMTRVREILAKHYMEQTERKSGGEEL